MTIGDVFRVTYMRLLGFFLLAATATVFAQGPAPRAVYRAPQKETRLTRISAQRPLAPAVERWLRPPTEEERTLKPAPAGVARIGFHRAITPQDLDGSWQTTREGVHVFRLILRSPGAQGIRLHLTDFHAGAGRLWVTELETEDPQTFGPYSGDGTFGDGDFWTNTALGEAVLIEFETTSRSRILPFEIREISHLSNLPVKVGSAKAANATRAASLGCNIDVTCRPDYAEWARSVARIAFETSEGASLCSGTVINTRSQAFIPFFMTAAHCLSTQAEARTVEAFFFFQSETCNGPEPPASRIRRTLGAQYMAGTTEFEQGDFTLLRLQSVPDGTVFSGWSADEHPIGAPVVGIHHPQGDLKKISFGQRGPAEPVAGLPASKYFTIDWREGITEQGSSGSAVFNEQGQLVGTLTGGLPAPEGRTLCDAPQTDTYSRFDAAFPTLRSFLDDRAGSGGTVAPPTGTELRNNVATPFTLDAVSNPTLFNGERGFRIVVPEGATELDIALTTQTPNADLDLYVSYEGQPSIGSDRVIADFRAETESGNERIVINTRSTPPLRAGTYFIAVASFTPNVQIRATINARISTTPPGGGSGVAGGTPLTSGQAQNFTLPAVNTSFLFNGSASYRIEVPAGATQLQVRLAATTPNVDIDLHVRFGADVTLQDTRIVSDHRSDGPTGTETITITPQSTPALRAGTYFISIAQFTTGVETRGTVTATVTVPGGGGGGGGNQPQTPLTSGQAQNFTLNAVNTSFLFNDRAGYRVDVPAGATQLQIRLAATTPNVDIDLHVRFGADVTLQDTRIVSDYRSDGPSGTETITITPQSSPALRAGTYFIAIAQFTTGVETRGTITATVTGGSGGGGNQPQTLLTSGVARDFTIPPGSSGTLLNGAQGYRIDVPQNATQLQIRLNTTTPNADLDLYARFGSDVVIENRAAVADHKSESDTGNEVITITAQSNPPLRPGTYFIALGLFAANVQVRGNITATVTTSGGGGGGNTGGGSTPVVLTSGVPRQVRINASDVPALLSGGNAYQITVPQGATRLRIDLRTATSGADLDLYANFGSEARVADGQVAADHRSETDSGNETIEITPNSRPALRPGTYFIQLVNFTPERAADATLTATVTTATAPPPSGPTQLTSGVAQSFTLGAVASTPALFNGNSSYRINVPSGSTRLTIRVNTTTPNANVDVYARFGSDVTGISIQEPVADHFSVSPTGNETIVVTTGSNPPLRAGTYFIALRQNTPGVAASGTITATAERAPTNTPIQGQELRMNEPISFTLPASDGPFLYNGADLFRVNVSQPGGFQLVLRTTTPGADLDIHVRFLQPPAIENGRIASDFSAITDSGDEELSILPNLIGNRLGTYYVALASFTPGRPISGTILMRPLSPGVQTSVNKSLVIEKERLAAKSALKPKVSSASVNE